MLDKIMWCLECEQEVLEKIHPNYIGITDYGEVLFDWCEGNFLCSCPPPDEPNPFDYIPEEPDEEFLEIIEQEAKWML